MNILNILFDASPEFKLVPVSEYLKWYEYFSIDYQIQNLGLNNSTTNRINN
jgi:hypothetical protein